MEQVALSSIEHRPLDEFRWRRREEQFFAALQLKTLGDLVRLNPRDQTVQAHAEPEGICLLWGKLMRLGVDLAHWNFPEPTHSELFDRPYHELSHVLGQRFVSHYSDYMRGKNNETLLREILAIPYISLFHRVGDDALCKAEIGLAKEGLWIEMFTKGHMVSRVLTFSLTDQEYQTLLDLGDAQGLDVTMTLRGLIRDARIKKHQAAS